MLEKVIPLKRQTLDDRKRMPQWLLLVLCGFSAAYAQSSCFTNQEGDVRLVQTSSITLSNVGRVEVCHNGRWGTVCASNSTTPWSEKNAQVVCRQLGFSGALNSILQDTVDSSERPSSLTPIHYHSVRCFGQERRLTDCSGISEITVSCTHSQDAYIVCRPQTLSISPVHTVGPQHGDIRLFADSDNGEGAVEFYHSSFGWTGICPDSSWDTRDAMVACRQLGYETGRAMTYESNFISQRFLSNVVCNEMTDIKLSNCTFSTFANCFISSTSFAGIQCSSSASTGSVRLFGGSTRRGIVEVFYDGRWGPVCSSSWGSSDARVVCGELGFNKDDASSYTSNGTGIESNLKPIWLTGVNCSSDDTGLTRDCIFSDPTGHVNCRNSFAGADCGRESTGLSSGAIFGIVFAVLVVIFIVLPSLCACGRDGWCKTHTYSWYQTMTHPGRWFSSSRDSWNPPRNNQTAEINMATTTTQRLSSHSSNPDSETEQASRNPDAEITEAAPPSYHAASNFPTANPSQAPPTDLPPPYPGPPADLRYSGGATAGCPPPASSHHPPVGFNYQGYPPLTYPPSTGSPGAPAPDLAFPPNTDTQQQSGGLPYPPGDGTPYPPNPTDIAPYPPDIVSCPSDTDSTAPPPQLDTGEYTSPEDSGGGADDD